MSAAFDGIRILDFSQGIPGPLATMLLADQGADVIKIEPPGGDRVRDEPGYLTWNRGKRRISLDLTRFEGLTEARKLLAGADVAVFDAHPGELEKLGLDATSVRAANPSLIHAWLPPYAAKGRWSQLPPSDALLSALGTVSTQQYRNENRPIWLVSPQVSYAHGMLAAGAIASALWERTQTGTGDDVVVTGLNAVASVHSGITITYGGLMDTMFGSSRGGTPNYRLYRCADEQWLFLGTLTAPFFLKALEALDLMDLIVMEGVDGEFGKLFQPPFNRIAIDRLDARFAEKPRAEWLQILADHGVPRAPVGERNHWFRDETVGINDMRLEFEDPKRGKVLMPGIPIKLLGTPGSVRGLMAESTPAAVEAHEPAAAAGARPASSRGPLAGVRVLDLGQFIAGTFAPTFLASFGADVIKVETLDGDPFRVSGLQFTGHNRGKRGLAIDLKSEAGREALFDMVRVSDVVLDNFRVGVRERLGITYDVLRAVNPRIITCSVTAYGLEGPLSNDPGFDPLLQARSGLMAAQGGDDEPVFFKVAVNDSASAMIAAFGTVAALFARERTGEGQEVRSCLANQSVLTQSGEITWYEGRPPAPIGGRDFPGPGALRRFYQCADGWIAIDCTDPAQFHQVCIGLGHPEWAGRSTAEQAMAEPAASPLADLIASALAAIPRAEALDRLISRGVPAAPAVPLAEFFNDPWANENGYFDTYTHPVAGPVTGPAGYASFGGRGGFERGTPLVGEHTVEVLRDLGFAEERIEKLLATGVIRQA